MLLTIGYYKIQIKIDDYQTQTLKKVGVDEARGRILIVKMVPITNKHQYLADTKAVFKLDGAYNL